MGKKSNRLIVQLITDSSFRNWCLGTARSDENEYWEDWISNQGNRLQDVLTAKKIVLELERAKHTVPEDRKYRNWNRLDDQITIPQNKLEPFQEAVSSPSSLGWILTAAASVMLLVVTLLAIEYTDLVNIPAPGTVDEPPVPALLTTSTDFGEQKIISLDSGTRITLNANSSATYFDGWVYEDTVQVRLQGEAFFDVPPRKSEEGPVFQVKTDDGNIHVLGTRFMVNTWDEKTKVVLEKGKVAIARESLSQSRNGTILKPNELAEFSRSFTDITIKSVNAKFYTSWAKGFFAFDRTPLRAVADRIEKIFGKEVVIADQELSKDRVSGSVENDDLQVLLSTLSRTLQIRIIEQEDQIIFKKAVSEGLFLNQTQNKRDSDD